jgi:predicted ATP-binding protein involved in virulence
MIPIKELNDRVFTFLKEQHDENPDFLFQLSGRSEFHQKGRYFYGSDTTIQFSCWNGSDNEQKTPNVYLVIETDGTMHLNFVAKSPAWKREYFEVLARVIGVRASAKAENDDNIFWRKYYLNRGVENTIEDCLEVLKYQFIGRDWYDINRFVKGEIKDIPAPPSNFLPPLGAPIFNRIKAEIERSIENQPTISTISEPENIDTTIQLKSLSITNIGLFRNTDTIDLDARIICFIGLNGVGKTTILRSLILGLVGYKSNTVIGENKLAREQIQYMLRIKGVNGGRKGKIIYENKAEIGVNYTVGNKNCNNAVFIECGEDEQEPTIYDSDSSDWAATDGNRKMRSLVLGFPQIQVKGDVYVEQKDALPQISDVIAVLDGQPDYRFNKFKKWLIELQAAINESLVNGTPDHNKQRMLTMIFEIISVVTDTQIVLHDIFFNHVSGNPTVWVKVGDDTNPILLDLVSQGYNNVFGWIGYMMRRMNDCTEDGADFSNTSALVLIDEIDTYLHPQWQSTIMAALVDNFPNVQFVITTHSPYVVGSVPKDKIKIYTCEKADETVEIAEFTEFSAFGADIERLTERLFKTNKRAPDVQAKLNTIADLVAADKLDEAEQLIEALKSDPSRGLSPDDPELERNELFIATKRSWAEA